VRIVAGRKEPELPRQGVVIVSDSLLAARPDGCDDILVDAGFVTEVHERALAVLVAAGAWAEQTGGRLRFAAMSPALLDTAGYFGVSDLLPRLPGPGGRADEVAQHQAR